MQHAVRNYGKRTIMICIFGLSRCFALNRNERLLSISRFRVWHLCFVRSFKLYHKPSLMKEQAINIERIPKLVENSMKTVFSNYLPL